jgi:hypothetical protein
MDEILDSDLAQAGGYLTWVSTITMTILEWVSSLEINDVLQGVAALGSLVFLFYKIQNLVLTNRSIRLDNKKKKKELEE